MTLEGRFSHGENVKILLQHLKCALWISGLFLSQAWYCGCSSHVFRNLHFPGILNWQWSRSLATDHAMLWFFIFIIFYLEHKWTRLMLCPLRNTFRKTHESSRKLIKMTSLKPGDGITLMHIFYLSGKILENTVL